MSFAAAKTQPPAPDNTTALELAASKAELAALKKDQQENGLNSALRSAAGDMFLDTDLATRLMRDSSAGWSGR